MKYRLILTVGLALGGGILLAVAYVNPYDSKIALSELVLQLSGSRGEFPLGLSMPELVSLIMRMLPNYIFQIYFGTAFYRRFCTASIYVFSRYPKRLNWYYGEALSLIATISLYQIILLATVIMSTALRYRLQADEPGFYLLFCHFVLNTFWLYAMTLSINLLAIWLGSSRAFMIVLGFQVICITLLGCVSAIEKLFDEVAENVMIFNPISRLILGWQNSRNQAVNQVLHSPYPDIELRHSFLLIFAVGSAILLFGGILVRNHDLITSNSETEAS